MSFKDKVQQYRVSIRRKSINQKMAQIRAKKSQSYATDINVTQIKAEISKIMNSNVKDVYQNVSYIKQYSNNEELIGQLKLHFQIFYNLLIEINSIPAQQIQKRKEQIYSDLSTIIINITSFQTIDFNQVITDDIASPLIANIKTSKREINTLWIIANILYRNNGFSHYFMKGLIKNKIDRYIISRIDEAFDSQTDTTIFYYFIGAITSNIGLIQQFAQYKQYLSLIEKLSSLQNQQLYWYILDGLMQHAFTFYHHNYEILSTKILDKCSHFCKNKKSNFILKYLQLLSNLLQIESQIIHNSGQQSRKICHDQYERLKKYKFLINLQYCLQNRSPEIKKWLFQIGYMLISLYFKDISFIDEYFYLTLSQEINKIQKYTQKLIESFLKYFNLLLSCLLTQININKNKTYCDQFIKFIKEVQLFSKLQYLLDTYSNSYVILDNVFNSLAYLIDYNINQVYQNMGESKIEAHLQILQLQNGQLDNKRQRLIHFLHQKLNN